MKRRVTIVIIVILAMISFTIYYSSLEKKTILKELDANDITKITIHALPPDSKVELSANEIKQLVRYLNQLHLYEQRKEDKLTGQIIHFIITKKDHSKINLDLIGDYVTLDGVNYRAEDEGSEKMNEFANGILKLK